MYPDNVDKPTVAIPYNAAVVITVRTADYIGIAEIVHNSHEPPRWECRTWDRDSGECLCDATFRNEAAARAWLLAMCGKDV
jgi:hypothetical protein